MNLPLSERLSLISLAIFFITFWLVTISKILSLINVMTFNKTISNVENVSFFIMIISLGIFIRFFFKEKMKNDLYLQHQSEDLKLRLDSINSTNAIIEFTPTGEILSINKKFTDIFKWKDELIGKHHRNLMPFGIAKKPEYKKMWIDLANGIHKFDEFHRLTKTGEDLWIIGTYIPVKNKKNEVYKIIKIAQDNTETFKALKELENKNTYLEYAAKIIRHDMHSGINTYIPRGLKSLLRRLDPAKIKKLKIEGPIKMIDEGLKHTQSVYKGVYAFTNLVKKDSILIKDLYKIDKILYDYLRRTAYISNVVIEDLPEIKVNDALFCTAIDNLIRNGLKYNDARNKKIRIYHIAPFIIIEDNGRGMTNEEFSLYSRPYSRKPNQDESGTGLGLNICISIIKEHNFSIHAKLNKSSGTSIYIKYK